MGFMGFQGDQARQHILFALWEFDREEKRGRGLMRCGHLVLPGILLEPAGAYTLRERHPVVSDLYVPVAPDIAIEVMRPGENIGHKDFKAQLYLRGGTQIFWVIHPDHQTIREYRPDLESRTLTIHDELQDDVVLPGFKLAVKAIFEE